MSDARATGGRANKEAVSDARAATMRGPKHIGVDLEDDVLITDTTLNKLWAGADPPWKRW